MREPNKNYVYSLEELTSEEYKSIYEYILINDVKWKTISFKYFKNKTQGMNLKYFNGYWGMCTEKPTNNAKELFYTLENVQVDCRELTDEQIKEMANVFESNGYKIWDDNDALVVCDVSYLLEFNKSEVFVSIGTQNKTTITYEKFMELFGNKNIEEVNINNIKVNCENLTNEGRNWVIEIFAKNGVSKLTSSDKFISSQNENLKEIKYEEFTKKFTPQYDVTMIVEAPNVDKPKHYANGIDTFERMEANCTIDECLAFAKGNIDKYNFRKKGQDLEDYTKIIAYANWAIKLLNKK